MTSQDISEAFNALQKLRFALLGARENTLMLRQKPTYAKNTTFSINIGGD